MAKSKVRSVYVCQKCGAVSSGWQGRCNECGEWNSLVEEIEPSPAERKYKGMTLNISGGTAAPMLLNDVPASEEPRFNTGLDELDQVLGGGLVRGSLVLLGGPPGIGKSTLLLQTAGSIGTAADPVLYISGEESPRQIKLRADRLGIRGDGVSLCAETSLDEVERLLGRVKPRLAIVDSIQTMFRSDLESAPGSVSQVRECAASLMRLAKTTGSAIILVGHVTKGGDIAGPRVLEHLVDTVLSFESCGLHNVRALRAVKNRFGSTQEKGFFSMETEGLAPIPDASAFFLSQRAQDITGSLIFPSLEGTRPLLVEVQALVTESYAAEMGAPPTRRSVGVDINRMGLLLAVLQKRCSHLGISRSDIYVNVAGGMRLNEPAMDLPILLAVASSRQNIAIPGDWAAIGEVGLGGEVRAVGGLDLRLAELRKLGFKYCIVPSRMLKLRGGGFEIDAGVRLSSKARIEEEEEPEDDAIGELKLGPPLGQSFNPDDPEAWKQLMKRGSEIPAPEARAGAQDTGDSASGKSLKQSAAEPSADGNAGGKLKVIPVENINQALRVLGIKAGSGRGGNGRHEGRGVPERSGEGRFGSGRPGFERRGFEKRGGDRRGRMSADDDEDFGSSGWNDF